uniref:Uncharacterized protein n=1 Tax=Ciona intestinalis TaxID=7719 RepID=F6V244_CIOIN
MKIDEPKIIQSIQNLYTNIYAKYIVGGNPTMVLLFNFNFLFRFFYETFTTMKLGGKMATWSHILFSLFRNNQFITSQLPSRFSYFVTCSVFPCSYLGDAANYSITSSIMKYDVFHNDVTVFNKSTFY